MNHTKQSIFFYRITQLAAFVVSKFIFKRKFLRNEIKNKKGPFVIIANHQAAFDFVNLIGATKVPMTFVISNAFYNTLPFKGIMNKIGVIPKQQFQTTITDMKHIKGAIEDGKILVIYPAGLMSEDGCSTPIPEATYKFLQWMKADIYVARTIGTYFAMPKWTKGLRSGRTFIDIYKLFDKEELETMDTALVKKKTDEALLFDAYREQEEYLVKYKNNDNIEGLENVLYLCPHCRRDFTIAVKDKSTILCTECGYAQKSDEYAFLHKISKEGEEIRYPSDWSRIIYQDLKKKIESGECSLFSSKTKVLTIDKKSNKYTEIGEAVLTIDRERVTLRGNGADGEIDVSVPTASFPSLPFSPGCYLEVQNADHIYRCALEDGRLVMKLVNAVKIFYELGVKTRERVEAAT